MGMDEAFLESIHQTPDDDTPRLIYADWLEDHGDEAAQPRAALIRAQCALERLPPNDPGRPAREAEAAKILKAHGKKWTADLRKAKLVSTWTFRRGFLDSVTMKAPRFATTGDRLFQLVPMLRAVRFPDASNELRYLTQSPHFSRLAEVDLSKMCSCGYCRIHAELRTLFTAPVATNVTVLNLADNRLDEAVLRDLISSPQLAGLTALNVSDNLFGNAGLTVLAETLPTTIRQLIVRNTQGHHRISVPGARALAGSERLAGLKVLDLHGNRLSSTGAMVVAESPHLVNLERLIVSDNKIGPAGAKALRARFGDRVEL